MCSIRRFKSQKDFLKLSWSRDLTEKTGTNFNIFMRNFWRLLNLAHCYVRLPYMNAYDSQKNKYRESMIRIWFAWFTKIRITRIIWFAWFAKIRIMRIIWFAWFAKLRITWFARICEYFYSQRIWIRCESHDSQTSEDIV